MTYLCIKYLRVFVCVCVRVRACTVGLCVHIPTVCVLVSVCVLGAGVGVYV